MVQGLPWNVYSARLVVLRAIKEIERSQKHDIRQYPESDESRPQLHTLFLLRSGQILSLCVHESDEK
jgi:hypothetical protein